MKLNEDERPNPDDLLKSIEKSENLSNAKKGKLKIFLGYAAGVGKTYAMLDEAQSLYKNGIDVLVGYVEPHTRPETLKLQEGLPALPVKQINYKDIILNEFDIDAALKRKPKVILVDELAHTNVVGSRNKKRYQDIEELLSAGVDVYTTVNIQHIESLNDIIEGITNVCVAETIPDKLFDFADIKLIDIDPEELLLRLKEGKIYSIERAQVALNNFFIKENLRLLREVAMRKAADRISQDNVIDSRVSGNAFITKFLACINTSETSSRVIRWTARAAEVYHAEWSVIFVSSVEKNELSKKDLKNLNDNIALAESLGGVVVELNGYDLSAMIANYAQSSAITNIVIGKSNEKKSLKNYFKGTLEEQIANLIPDIEIHIITHSYTGQNEKYKIQKAKNYKFSFSWEDFFKTIIILTMATLISFFFGSFEIDKTTLVVFYILAVVIVSRFTDGYFYGMFASFLSAILVNIFFVEPYFAFNISIQGYSITFGLMILVAFITSAMTNRIKMQAKLSVKREKRLEILYELNTRLLYTRGIDNIGEVVVDYLENNFKRSVSFYTKNKDDKIHYFFKRSEEDALKKELLSEDEKAVAFWVLNNQKIAGAGTNTLSGALGFYLPVISQNKVLGIIGISCKDENYLDNNDKNFCNMVAAQIAMALERQNLSDSQRNMIIDSEKEKMRGNLLRAISHDIRTPLTSILGSSSALLENSEKIDEIAKRELLENIKEESQWLIRIVENLLSITKINDGKVNLSIDDEVMEEIISESVNRIRKRFPERKIAVKIPEEVLICKIDGALIEQVIINLLENAIKNSSSDSDIIIELEKDNDYALVKVIDEGSGIPEDEMPFIFEATRNKEKSPDASRGMGIGLSICMSIIKAHDGIMEVYNKKDKGAVFFFKLKLSKKII